MDKEFDFSIYSRRWGHDDDYSLKITDKGWNFLCVSVPMSGECDKAGNPFLINKLENELINYPKDLGEYLEWLWEKVKKENLTDEKIQESLNILAEWINLCEKNSPKGIWETMK
ncbi:hypothetical protein [Clostridium felsineum]|uniref:hypothetical protein n=1 Tax=Clostridium felsineum TaxID=36839 RepID=UPI00098CA2C9|nr:hypothetical protein [Clostridium felsineum]URZ16360.1 hypothetical protein CLFE_024070 [Clostridium felsineum DSM 794]